MNGRKMRLSNGDPLDLAKNLQRLSYQTFNLVRDGRMDQFSIRKIQAEMMLTLERIKERAC